LDKKDTALKNTKLDQQNDTKDYNDAIREATIVFEPILEHKDETINATDKGSLSDITLEDETTVSSQDESKAMSDISLEDPSAETISFDGAPEKEAAVTPTQDDHIHSKEISLEPEDVDFEEPKHSSSLHTLEEEDEEDQDENAQQKEKQSFNPLSIITKGLVTGEQPIITTVPVPTDPAMIHKTKETTFSPSSSVPNSPRQSLDNESISSTTSKSIFGRWAPFRSSSSSATSPSTSRRPSKQHSAPIPSASRPSASFAARQSQLSRPNSIISPLPGFQETLLAQMEQLNVSNTNDPKSKVLKNLKRQSIRQSLVSQNKGDEYDWGKDDVY
jgi:hypothetical protein